jgi:RHS repeat-associated protein
VRIKSLFILLVAFSSLSLLTPTAAQSDTGETFDDRMTYGETVAGLFDVENPPPHRWTFEAAPREQVRLTLRRVGGQFTPTLRILNPNGEVIPHQDLTGDVQVFSLMEGTQSGQYTVEIGGDIPENTVINPPEYTLTLERIGVRPEHRNVGLAPLPILGTEPFPDLFSADAIPSDDANRLGITVFGGTATRPNVAGEPSRFVIEGDNGRTLELTNRNPIQFGIESVGFVDGGLGFQLTSGAQFFTDQDVIGLTFVGGVASFTLSNGQTFISDFFGMDQVWAVGDLVAIRLSNGNRVLLSGNRFDLQRQGGAGAGPNAENTWVFGLQNDDVIITDGEGWDTLAYVITENGPQTRALYGADMRFITDLNRVTLVQQGNHTRPDLDTPELDPLVTEVTLAPLDGTPITLTVDPTGMGDIEVQDDTLFVRPLDGRILREPLLTMVSGLIEDRALYINRADGSTRLSLPDGTEIEGVAALPVPDNSALPNEVGYIPRGRNNLGTTYIDLHPQITPPDGLLPVNRANGNFYYPVEEFHVPSHTVELTWTRHYNSLAPTPNAPAAFLSSSTTYPILGMGWRHSYQYELDLRTQHFGEVRLILPDGATHVFTENSNIPAQFQSQTLLSWTLTRLNGETGAWQVTTLDGITYDFDRAGRLTQTTDTNGLSLRFSPAPRSAVAAMEADDGMFIIEPYGRRFEVYTDEDGRVTDVLDAQRRGLQYTYDGVFLANVIYPDATQTATYTYTNGVLSSLNDVYSPYHDDMAVQTDPQGRVSRIVLNPDGRRDLQQTTHYEYDAETDTTIETTTVNGSERISRWRHDDLFRLVRHDTPVEAWTYLYQYEGDTDLLREITQPDLTRIGVRFDEQGYLTELLDPLNRGSAEYNFSYVTLPNGLRRLVEIEYPTLNETSPREQFVYDDNGQPIERIRTGLDTPTEVIRYEYDLRGRLVTQRLLANDESGLEIVNRFEYDEFGYLSRASTADGIEAQGYRHDLAGRLIGFIDVRGVETTLTWNLERNLLTGMQVNNTQASVSYQYDERNNITAIQEGEITTNFTYNSLNQVVSMIDPLGQTTLYEHDVRGNLTAIILPDSPEDPSITRYAYDDLDRLAQSTSPSGLVTAYNWRVAEASNQTVHTITDPFGDSLRYVYNGLGRVASVRKLSRDGTRVFEYSLNYDPLGRLTNVVEVHVPDTRRLAIQYDAWGRPTQSRINDLTTTYTYDPFGRLQAVTLPGDRTVQYDRDALGDIRTAIYPDGETTQQYRYAGNGTLASFISPLGFETLYSYDSLNRLTSILHPDNSRESYTYDAQGNITAYTDPRDNQTLAEYDALGRLTRLQDPGGVAQTFNYDPLGQLTEVLQGGSGTRYTYDREGNTVAVTPPESRAILYSYDSLGRITSVTNAVGHSTRYTYSPLNRVSTIIDPLGNETGYTWSRSGRLLFMETPLGQRYEYAYDDLGRLTRITDRAAESNPIDTQLVYTASGDIAEIRFATPNELDQGVGTRHRYQYDTNGRLVSYLPPESDTPWLLEYDAEGQLISATDPRGFQTSYRYDALGRVIEVVYPDETRVEYTYDAAGNVTELVETDGLISTFVYDENNRLVQRTDNPGPNARTQTFSYDELGNLVLWADTAGNTTSYRYDSSGRVRLIERGRGEDVLPLQYRYTYDPVGNLTQILLPNNTNSDNPDISLTYDNLNRRIRYVDPLANVWSYSYDAESNLIQFSDPLGSTTQYGYDGANRLNRIIHPVGAEARLRYDLAPTERGYVSPQIESIDEQRNRERINYRLDRAGRLVVIDRGDDVETRFNRDNLGNVVERINPDGTITNYTYDARNRMISANAPDHSLDVSYDEAGRIRQIRNPNSRYIFTYDDLGQLVTVRGDARIAYTYDTNGNLLVRDADELGVTAYTYDDLNRPVRIEKNGNGIDITYVTSEDGSFQRDWIASITRDNGSRTTYTYDLTGRVQQIIHFDANDAPVDILNYTYDAVGNINRITRLDGWTIIYSYDANHQVTSERWLDDQNQTAYAASYRYDEAGNRTERTVRLGFEAPIVTRYAYNPGNQLVQETRNISSGTNETTWVIGMAALLLSGGGVIGLRRRRQFSLRWLALLPVLFVVPVAAGIVQQETGDTIEYAYDTNGNLSTITYPDGQTRQHSYDSQNRLARVQGVNNDGRTVDISFRYDAFSRVHIVNDNIHNESYRLHYDGHDLIGMEDVNSGDLQSYFVPFPGQIHRTDDAEGTQYWRLHDALGSVRLALSGDGSLIEPDLAGLNYDSFGQLITPYGSENAYVFGPSASISHSENADARSLPPEPITLFRGELIEPDTGYYLMGLRAYDPGLGRFIQRDPLRHDPLGTLYTYAYNRPGIYTDPTGTTPQIAQQGVEAVNIPTSALPNSTPSSLLPNLPTPDNVGLLQAQEMHRPLALTHLLQSTVNDTFASLTPTDCAFRIRHINPIHLAENRSRHPVLTGIVNTFDPQTGWIPSGVPDVNVTQPPFAPLIAALPTLEQTEAIGKLWQSSPCSQAIALPIHPEPMPFSAEDIARADLIQTLLEVPLYPATRQQIAILTDPNQTAAVGGLGTDLAWTQLEPEIDILNSGGFGQLYDDTLDFYSSTLTLPVPGPTDYQPGPSTVIDIIPQLP